MVAAGFAGRHLGGGRAGHRLEPQREADAEVGVRPAREIGFRERLVFQPRIPWESLLESYTVLLAIDATLLILAAWIFQRRDFKS